MAATASACSSLLPKWVSSTHARFQNRCASTSHVNPMPPCTWMPDLPLREGGVAGHDLGAAAAARPGRRRSGRRARTAARVHRGTRDLGPHEHVGAEVLDRLERADHPPELLALLGVRGRELGGARRASPSCRRAGEHGADEAARAPRPRRSAISSPAGTSPSTIAHRRERVDRAVDARVVTIAAGSTRRTPSGAEHEQRVEVGRDARPRVTGVARLEHADDRLARRRAGDPRRGEEGGHERPGHQRAPELLEHERRLGDAELEPAVGFGQA